MAFKTATKKQSKLRMAIDGPSGSGKTYTSLAIATEIAGQDGKIAVIDTERGSASKYSDVYKFMVDELESFHPDAYINAINDAVKQGFTVLVIDSLSHAWMGKDGVLEQVDKSAARSNTGNSFTAWKDGTKLQNKLIDAILQAPIHIIVTMRSKTEHSMEKNAEGKTVIKKMGMAPIQRDGLEYEFDVVGDMDQSNTLVVSKTRCSALTGAVIEKPGAEIARALMTWLNGPTPEEIETYVISEVSYCQSKEDLSKLKFDLMAKGEAFFTEKVKSILREKFDSLSSAKVDVNPLILKDESELYIAPINEEIEDFDKHLAEISK
jgi:KaiC/GvpD/RAD55 family RecA-like ATPase